MAELGKVFFSKTAKKLHLKELPKFGPYFFISEKKKRHAQGFSQMELQTFSSFFASKSLSTS